MAVFLLQTLLTRPTLRAVLQFLPIAFTEKSAPIIEESTMNLRFCQIASRVAALPCLAILLALPAMAQSANFFPANQGDGESEVWSRVAIPPDHPVSQTPQWHIDYAKKQILCDGNGGHEWLRFDRKFTNFAFHVKWRFTPVKTPNPKYNSGVFFRNNLDGSIWHQAQTSQAGGYIFGLTPIDGKPTRFSLQKDMTENRVKAPGEWNTFDIRCVGDTCTLAVNGTVVNTAKVGQATGYVGLESEGYQITFKDLRLHELK
jgi:hypothetical protein